MELSLPNHIETHVDPDVIARVVSIINTGRAILFTGAGFSVGCENVLKTSPPKADKLAKLISQKGNFEEDNDRGQVNNIDRLHLFV